MIGLNGDEANLNLPARSEHLPDVRSGLIVHDLACKAVASVAPVVAATQSRSC